MRRLFNKIICFILLIASLFLISCTRGSEGIVGKVTPYPDNITSAPITQKVEPTKALTEPKPTQNVNPKNLQTVQFYSIDERTQEKEARTTLVSSTAVMTPALVLDFVIDSLDEQGIDISIESVDTEADKVYVSFVNTSFFTSNLEYDFEVEILDAIAQSVLDNFSEYSKVIYQIEGNNYSSNNLQLELEEIYLER